MADMYYMDTVYLEYLSVVCYQFPGVINIWLSQRGMNDCKYNVCQRKVLWRTKSVCREHRRGGTSVVIRGTLENR